MSNLNAYKYMDFLRAKTPEDLKRMIAEITLPVKILAMYHDGSSHVAWVNLTKPIKKVPNKQRDK